MEEIDISGFTAVATINAAFLYNCMALQEFDFSPLSSLTALAASFMHKCASLTEIDLSPLTSVTAIGNDVLRELTKVEKINMSGLSCLQRFAFSGYGAFSCRNNSTAVFLRSTGLSVPPVNTASK